MGKIVAEVAIASGLFWLFARLLGSKPLRRAAPSA
jgi:hypothetical protein